MSDLREREIALLLDVSNAGNSARACHMADEFAAKLSEQPAGILVDLNAGELLLTRSILLKIRSQIERAGAVLGTVYSTVPQTQQAALDEGVYVKTRLKVEWRPLRSPLPAVAQNEPIAKAGATPPAPPRQSASPSDEISLPGEPTPRKAAGVDLPAFRKGNPIAPDITPKTGGSKLPPDLRGESAAAREGSMPERSENALPDLSDLDVNVLPQPLSGLSTESLLTQTTAPISGEPMEEITAEWADTTFETLYLRQTLRSGQFARFNGNIVLIGDAHPGSEIIAGGDIIVWGELRGIAHAGSAGNYKAEIRAMKIEALQLRIADYIARRPDRIYYHKDGSESAAAPELARVADGEIKVFKN